MLGFRSVRRHLTTRRVLMLMSLVACFQVWFLFDFVTSRYNHYFLSDLALATMSNGQNAFQQRITIQKNCVKYFDRLLKFDEVWGLDVSKDSSPRIKSVLSHVRIYEACFLKQFDLEFPKIGQLDQKLFPFFNQNLPVYRDYTGAEISSSVSPNGREPVQGQSFWKSLRDNLKGKGIVISIGRSHVNDAVNLIRVLNFLGNTLPIEFIHRGDIGKAQMKKLHKAAVAAIKLNGRSAVRSRAQSIVFVDVSTLIHPHYKNKIKSFSNKWLAALFNSFEEMILMDCDAVPFLNPSELFELDQYRISKALFFRDRELPEKKVFGSIDYQSLVSSPIEASAFNIPPFSLNGPVANVLESNNKHFMESGVVLLDHGAYLSGLLVSLHLQLWKATSGPVYGDKELWWLGQLISGNHQFQFNNQPAASIGILNHDPQKRTASVCSIQIAHFDDSDRLLWLNGGLRNCKKNTWKKDFDLQPKLRENFKLATDLRSYFRLPVQINAAIIPHAAWGYEAKSGSLSRRIYNTLANLANVFRVPISNFFKDVSLGCDGYHYCATLNNVTYSESKFTLDKGKLIEFNKEQLDHLNDVIQVWNGK